MNNNGTGEAEVQTLLKSGNHDLVLDAPEVRIDVPSKIKARLITYNKTSHNSKWRCRGSSRWRGSRTVDMNRIALESVEVAYRLENKRRGRKARRLYGGCCGSCRRNQMQTRLRVWQSVPHTRELRHEKGQSDSKKMDPYGRKERLLPVRGAHRPDTRDSQSTSRSSLFLCTKSPLQRELITTV
jgi:hypothetical protein